MIPPVRGLINQPYFPITTHTCPEVNEVCSLADTANCQEIGYCSISPHVAMTFR